MQNRPSPPSLAAADFFPRAASRVTRLQGGEGGASRRAIAHSGESMLALLPLVFALAAAPADGLAGFLAGPGQQFILLGAIGVMFYFMILRPQQRRAREHAARIGSIKRGDTVVLSSGTLGKVVRVEDGELGVEIAQNVTIKVVKGMVAEVRPRDAPANDAKS